MSNNTDTACTADQAEWPRLTVEEHGDLRRVRAIIQRLHHRERGEWGDPLDGALAVLAKVIDRTDPHEATKQTDEGVPLVGGTQPETAGSR